MSFSCFVIQRTSKRPPTHAPRITATLTFGRQPAESRKVHQDHEASILNHSTPPPPWIRPRNDRAPGHSRQHRNIRHLRPPQIDLPQRHQPTQRRHIVHRHIPKIEKPKLAHPRQRRQIGDPRPRQLQPLKSNQPPQRPKVRDPGSPKIQPRQANQPHERRHISDQSPGQMTTLQPSQTRQRCQVLNLRERQNQIP